MPYIKQEDRRTIDDVINNAPGNLNYAITSLVVQYMNSKGGMSYTNVNEVIGVLDCAKMELYRRLAGPYEDQKCNENGDVYGNLTDGLK